MRNLDYLLNIVKDSDYKESLDSPVYSIVLFRRPDGQYSIIDSIECDSPHNYYFKNLDEARIFFIDKFRANTRQNSCVFEGGDLSFELPKGWWANREFDSTSFSQLISSGNAFNSGQICDEAGKYLVSLKGFNSSDVLVAEVEIAPVDIKAFILENASDAQKAVINANESFVQKIGDSLQERYAVPTSIKQYVLTRHDADFESITKAIDGFVLEAGEVYASCADKCRNLIAAILG